MGTVRLGDNRKQKLPIPHLVKGKASFDNFSLSLCNRLDKYLTGTVFVQQRTEF